MKINECYDLFEIKYGTLDSITIEDLRKKYHKLCLKYHPDKNQSSCSKEQFIYVQQAYDKLLQEKVSCSNGNKETNIPIYETILSLFNLNNLEKMIDWLHKYKCREHVIYLHAELSQLFHKDVYVHDGLFIPLWHKILYRNEIESSCEESNQIFCIIVKDIPNHLKILDNNDIIISLQYPLTTKNIGKHILIHICENKKVDVVITQTIYEQKYHVLLKQGIPRVCKTNLYDISDISNIILCFSK
jgi:hypothetical protein